MKWPTQGDEGTGTSTCTGHRTGVMAPEPRAVLPFRGPRGAHLLYGTPGGEGFGEDQSSRYQQYRGVICNGHCYQLGLVRPEAKPAGVDGTFYKVTQ